MVDIAEITRQAQAMSAQNGQSPEQNAYSILRNVYGMTNAQMDNLWGFAPGSVDQVFGRQDGAGVGVGGQTSAPAAPAFDTTGLRPVYAQKTVERKGAPMQMDDTSKILAYTKDNGNGTYSEYSPTGTLVRTYEAKTGFANGLSQTLDSIGSDKSGVLSNFVAPAALMGTGAYLANGGLLGAEAAAAGAGGSGVSLAGGSGTLGAASAGSTGAAMGAGSGLGAASAGSTAGAIGSGTLASGLGATGAATGATLGAGSAAATGAALGGATLSSGLAGAGTVGVGGGLLSSAGGAALAGAVFGAAGSKDTTTTATSNRDPWAPAQPYLVENLRRNALMQNYYRDNPFSQEQKKAYQGLLDANANGQANVPVMGQIANNFMNSKRGQMAAMPAFKSGVTAAPIDWNQYTAVGGLLK